MGCLSCVKDSASHPFATIALLVMIIIDFVMLVVGLYHRNGCPLDDYVPLYLIVAGGVGLVSKILHVFNKSWKLCIIDIFCYLVYFVELIWMILGSYWVYRLYKPNYDPDKGQYCNETVYLLSFWFITIHWILAVLSIFLSFCCCCCPNFVSWFNWRDA